MFFLKFYMVCVNGYFAKKGGGGKNLTFKVKTDC